MASIKEQDRWLAGATIGQLGGDGNDTTRPTSVVDVVSSMTTQFYLQTVVDDATADGWSVTQGASTWWPDETPWFRTLLIVLYGFVFVSCVVGNLLVILVILCHRKMRNDVNFFLSNLALADLCVGVFCVLPNLSLYISQQRWLIGQTMCKLFYFFQSLNYSCSIIILTVISLERYLAIKYPMLSRRRFTRTLFLRRVVTSVVWITSVVYSLPLLLGYDIHYDNYVNQSVSNMDVGDGEVMSDPYCYNSNTSMNQVYVMVDFVLLYIVPLSLMTFMYSKISVVLWRTGDARVVHSPRDVHVATVCRALSEDARRSRSSRGDSLRNPSSLLVQLNASVSSSTNGDSPGISNVPPCAGYNDGSDVQFRFRSASASRLSSSHVQPQMRNHSVCGVPAAGRHQWDEQRPVEQSAETHQSTSVTTYPALIRHKSCSLITKLSAPFITNDRAVTHHSGHDEDGVIFADSAVVLDKWDEQDLGRPLSRQSSDGGRQSSNSNHRHSPIAYLHHQHHQSHPQQQQRFRSEVDARPRMSTTPVAESLGKRKSIVCRSSISSTLQQNALLGRRRVIRLLIMFVVSFALCMLPHHARLQWQRWAPDADTHSELVFIVPPITTLMFYINSCLNPFLYALVSDKFRRAVFDIRCWRLRRPREMQFPLNGLTQQGARKSGVVNGYSTCNI